MVVVDCLRNSNILVIRFSGSSIETKDHIKLKSIHEFLSLYSAAKEWWYKSSEDSDDIYAPYKGKVKEVYDKIVLSRHLDKVFDNEASFLPQTPGLYKIIRFASRGTLNIVKRKKREKTSRNGVCVDNETADMFYDSCRKSGDTDTIISMENAPYAYNRWSKILDEEYERQYALWNQKRT